MNMACSSNGESMLVNYIYIIVVKVSKKER